MQYLDSCIACAEGKRLVIIGTSFIGMELGTVASKRKLASIDVIGLTDFPLEAILGKEVGQAIQKVGFFIRKTTRSILSLVVF